jgi:hypothetical protein
MLLDALGIGCEPGTRVHRIFVIYFVLALLFALSLLWLLVRFLSCCCSPVDAAFCQLTWLP